ncbi:dihydrofolate reductase family protein [Chitinophaga flava]|uniref:Dihydrofolate reductase n=1 Tax=Chitinophaga flava TaxID=2259036 RepID=A0A365XWC3_9BACT|nr:dihydrofolate reductase family protein [Chitinophaga flava]RBL89885.1 dihydrofolate reductase [Chitinophaga flava]
MRKLIMKMSISVDGFVGGPNGEKDWVFQSSDEASRAWSVGQIVEAGLLIMGRKSFETLAAYWPTATGPFAAPMNETPKAVFTQKGFKVSPDTAASWADTRVFDGDLAESIKLLKQEPGKPILALGGAGFMRSLIGTGLIDEYRLAIHPTVLGAGLPIFNAFAKPLDLKLVAAEDFPGGIVVHTYKPA